MASSRPCPAVPPCPQPQACSTGPARAFLLGEPVLDRLFKGTLVPFIPPHVWAGRAPCPLVTPRGHFQAQGSSSAMSLGEFKGEGRDAGTHVLQSSTGPCSGDRAPGEGPLATEVGSRTGGELQSPARPFGSRVEEPHELISLFLAGTTRCWSSRQVLTTPDLLPGGRSGRRQQQSLSTPWSHCHL